MALSLEEDIRNFFICIKENYISDCALYQFGSVPSDSMTGCLPGYINETFAAYNMDERRLAVKLFIRLVSAEYFDAIIAACLECFYPLIQSNLVPAKHVCDELLLSHEEIVKNPVFFKQAVHLMDRIVRHIDYKGCRDIFAKALGLYKNYGEGEDQIFLPAFQLLSTLMDRSLCLMPAYFALHEVTKLTQSEIAVLHPLLREKLTQFRNSFKDVANMFSHKVMRQMTPVAGVSNHCLSSPSLPHSQSSGGATNLPVNLIPATGCLDLKGPLPYDQELQQPHSQLVRSVLTQQGSMDLLLSLLSLHSASRSVKLPRCIFLERCLIDTIMWAVDETETCESDEEVAWSEVMWRHLGLYSIHLCRNHLVRFPELCLGILEGLQERQGSHKRSAPHIAWMLFNFFGAQNKNPLGDFAPILRILDALFPDGAAEFDTALLVWFSLTQKSNSTGESLPRVLPPQLKPMMSQLTERFQQMSQSSAYSVSLAPDEFQWFAYVYNAYAHLAQTQVVSPLNSKLVEALKRPEATALSYPSLCQFATMSLIALNSLLQSLLTGQIDSHTVLETYARTTVLMHHDLNLQPKSVLIYTESFRASGSAGDPVKPIPVNRFLGFVVELATFHLSSMEPVQRQLLANNLVALAKSNRLSIDTELCMYRQLQVLLSPALQVTGNHVKKLYVSWICGSDQDELNKYLLMLLCHQLLQQRADPDGALLTDFVQPLFQKCSAACQVPQSMRPHMPAGIERICVPPPQQPDRPWHSQQATEAARLCQRILLEGQCDETQLASQGLGCLYWVALGCLRERSGELPAAQLFARVHESLGPRGALPHLRVFCDLLVQEADSAAPAGEADFNAAVLSHVCSLVFSHRLLPLHRLILVLMLRPYPERRLELAAFRVLRYLLAPESANSPVAAMLPLLNAAPPCGGSDNLSGLVAQLRSVYDDVQSTAAAAATSAATTTAAAPASQQSPVVSSLYSHTATRVSLVMDTVLTRLVQLQPANFSDLLTVCAPFVRHMPSPGTCLLTLLTVYNPQSARVRALLTARLLGPRMTESPEDAYLPSACLPALHRCVDAASSVDQAEAAEGDGNVEEFQRLLGSPEVPLRRLSQALASHGRRGAPARLDWASHEWPNPLAHTVNCCVIHLMLLASPPGGETLALTSMRDEQDWQSAGLLLAQMPSHYAHAAVHQPVLGLFDQLAGAPPELALGPRISAHPEVCLWFAYASHTGPGWLAQLPGFFRHQVRPRVRCEAQLLLACHLVGPLLADMLRAHNSVQNELVAELYHCLAEVGSMSAAFQHQDAISDFFYHIKYMFVGDGVRRVAAGAIERLSPAMQVRLRSIAPPLLPAECADTPMMNYAAQQD